MLVTFHKAFLALVDWEGRGRAVKDSNVKFRPISVEDCRIPEAEELKDKKLTPCVSWQQQLHGDTEGW